MPKAERIDKEYLYGNFNESEKSIQDFNLEIARKNADMGSGRMDGVDINNTRTGIGWKELAVAGTALLGAAGLLIGAGLIALTMWLSSTETVQPQPPEVEQTSTERTETITRQENIDLIFHDGQGNRIVVPRKAEVE